MPGIDPQDSSLSLPRALTFIGGIVGRGVARRVRNLPRRLRDTRVLASLLAIVLIVGGLGIWWSAGPAGDLSALDPREIPGSINSIFDQIFSGAKPEAGYPRIRIDKVNIDLLIVKGDGKTPPVKYEAFTYPGADYLLTGSQSGGGNTYLYSHARTGMFWRLHDLHIGDVVTIDYGSNKVLKYRVSEIHPKVYWKDFAWLQPTTDDRLTLQTCNGWQDSDPRFIVVAVRIPTSSA